MSVYTVIYKSLGAEIRKTVKAANYEELIEKGL